MTFLPPTSLLHQLAEERLPRRRHVPDTATAPTSRGSTNVRVVEALELEPELRNALVSRVTRDRTTTTSVISEALRQYLAS